MMICLSDGACCSQAPAMQLPFMCWPCSWASAMHLPMLRCPHRIEPFAEQCPEALVYTCHHAALSSANVWKSLYLSEPIAEGNSGVLLGNSGACLRSLKGNYTVSKSKGPIWRYFITPAAARGFLATKRRICHAISDAPSFFLGKGLPGGAFPRNLHGSTA